MVIKNGVSAIANEVVDDVQKEAETIIQNAEKEAKETLKAARQQAIQNYQAIINQAKTKSEGEKRKIASVTDVELRNRQLLTKEVLVDIAFEKVLEKLRDFVTTDDYYNYLLNLIADTSRRLQQKNLVIQVNDKDKNWLTQNILNRLSEQTNCNLKVSEESMNFMGGCIIQTEDGKVTYDSTIDNRLKELKPNLRVEVAKILFEKEN